MKTPQTPHYHVVCSGSGMVWTSEDEFSTRRIGQDLRSGGASVDHISCPVGMSCPDEVIHRWETGRAPAQEKLKYGRRVSRPKKSVAMKSPAYNNTTATYER